MNFTLHIVTSEVSILMKEPVTFRDTIPFTSYKDPLTYGFKIQRFVHLYPAPSALPRTEGRALWFLIFRTGSRAA